MSIFYCRLAKENTKRVYQFLKKGLGFNKEIEFHLQKLHFKGKEYTLCFHGEFINKEQGETYLKKQNIAYRNDLEYLIALYALCKDHIKEYISENSFLLVDDQNRVFIYSELPLYYARKWKGEIYICSEKDYLDENNVFKLREHSCLRFFNNNLQALS